MITMEAIRKFRGVLENHWSDLPIEVCHAWEDFENATGTYESDRGE